MIADRITLDIDHYEPNFRLKALRAYHGLQNLDIVEEVVVHISTGGSGLHIEGHLSERASGPERFVIRRMMDDEKRTVLDRARGSVGHATDIYWAEKDGNEGERQEMTDIWAALDYLEKTRCPDCSRVKAAVNHGHKGVADQHGFNRPSMVEEETEGGQS